MIAIEVPEADWATQGLTNVTRGQIAHVRLDGGVALARKPVTRAVRMKEIEHALVRPVERVDAERALAGRQSERHRDEEAALERADFGDVTLDVKFALA